MHRRQQTDNPTSKINYQVSSPYIELLQSKKKVFGHKYENKNNRSFTANMKPSFESSNSVFATHYKPYKAISSQKNRINKSAHTKKKKTYTEQADQKMHQSLYIQENQRQKPEYHASKSLFYGDGQGEQAQSYIQVFNQTGKKNSRKRHLSENKPFEQIKQRKNLSAFQNLKINDIDSLIELIDNCVQEANQYIAYLSEKVETLKQQLLLAKTSQNQIQLLLKEKDQDLKRKQFQIMSLSAELQNSKFKEDTSMEVKNLLEVLEKMNYENQQLRKKLQHFEKSSPTYQEQNSDYYKEIHSNIDILNISIGSKKHQSPQRIRDLVKKYKFIKHKQK